MTYTGSKGVRTKYKGVMFRSRLESRWAGYFDKIGIPWKYEPAKYLIDRNRYYTPDFVLDVPPTVICEVKPTWQIAVDDARLHLLSAIVDNLCIFLVGDPLAPVETRRRKKVSICEAHYIEEGASSAVWYPRVMTLGEWLRILDRDRGNGNPVL